MCWLAGFLASAVCIFIYPTFRKIVRVIAEWFSTNFAVIVVQRCATVEQSAVFSGKTHLDAVNFEAPSTPSDAGHSGYHSDPSTWYTSGRRCFTCLSIIGWIDGCKRYQPVVEDNYE
ncbi:hypothetical protein T4D_1674 [Trichinella pseudospiralis]|uniref:Uncharacterized protein n=1 Tax=Trichinella pseudospiralis TaxID=6337 RepID=A0A0V1F7Q3_TRIPS|nr:hypothetical protein T4D_1674 [Trichinella pseudospiralis]